MTVPNPRQSTGPPVKIEKRRRKCFGEEMFSFLIFFGCLGSDRLFCCVVVLFCFGLLSSILLYSPSLSSQQTTNNKPLAPAWKASLNCPSVSGSKFPILYNQITQQTQQKKSIWQISSYRTPLSCDFTRFYPPHKINKLIHWMN